ncbi:uncharacterized protein LODBEIA_P40110 [Lodderomyces beijingensis]|uniref:D-isomer specific 2-hydroxyacid dehydrogenase NAD-binding domain-containing protein n=1 Tax=Lodderomyces beijingensis TaxID=1775926 RepID=A0ABP0ZR18_9ASCO
MTKPEVLFVGTLNKDLPQYKSFAAKFNCLDYVLTTREQFQADLATKFSNISAIYGAWLGFLPIGGFRTVLESAAASPPKHLKIIAYCSVGYDHQDAEALAQHDIVMTNVPSDGAANPVADLVVYYAILAFRQFHMYSKPIYNQIPHTIDLRHRLAQGKFDHDRGQSQMSTSEGDGGSRYHFGETINGRANCSPAGHTAAIIGFGKIGQLIGKKLDALGMDIVCIKRTPLTQQDHDHLGYRATYAPHITQTGPVDLIVIACPETPETHHLINSHVIDAMAKPFRLVNIGRGSVVDEDALLQGLKSGKVLFAGLDVFENEPALNLELINRDDVVVTPHIGASTVENFDYTAVKALKNIELVLDGKDAISRVN